MSALDIKLAIDGKIKAFPDYRAQSLAINPHVTFLDLTCPGGVALDSTLCGYTTLKPNIPYPGSPDGAVVVTIDNTPYVNLINDPEQQKSFEEEVKIQAKTLIQDHCQMHCEDGNHCQLRRKES